MNFARGADSGLFANIANNSLFDKWNLLEV